MKKGVLYQYHIEIENWKEKGSILILFNRANIAAFYQVYQNDLDAIFKELKKLQREFMVFEKDKIKVDNKMLDASAAALILKSYLDKRQRTQ